MFKLVIRVVSDPKARAASYEARGNFEFETEDEALERGARWVKYCPNDIVMMVEIDKAVCKWCGNPIKEKTGWIIHKWVHEETEAHMCWNNSGRQAEPVEGI